MKILKYIIFFSALSGIFFVVYHQSDEKGFARVWLSFKMATVIGAVSVGLIPISTKEVESFVTNNQVVHEKVIDNEELNLNLFEQNNQQVILVKGENNPISPSTNRGPSNFPTPPPPSIGRATQPNRPATNINPPSYRAVPKVVDKGLGAARNPAPPGKAANPGKGDPGNGGGGGGAPEFDDQCPVPKKEQVQKSNDYYDRSNDPKKKKKKKQSTETEVTSTETEVTSTCEIHEKFESNAVKKLVKKALKNNDVANEYRLFKKRAKNGIHPKDMGPKTIKLPGNRWLVKEGHSRFVVEVDGNNINILGMVYRGSDADVQTFKNAMNQMYGLNLQY